MSTSITPLTFTGVSSFSNDFQTILNRAVQIANLPVKQLQNQQTDIQQEKVLAGNLNAAVGDLASSVTALGTLGQSQALTATSSDSTVATATATGITAGQYYSITNVTSIAHAASETSLQGYATSSSTPVSSTGTVQLTIGTTVKNIPLAAGQNNLNGLRDAINALGLGVTASVLTTGTGANSNYLSVSATASGQTTLKLVDDPGGANTALLSSVNQGANTVFNLNGLPISSPSTEINNVVPGLSLSIHNTTSAGQTVSISLDTDRSQLSTALQDLVTKYNAVADQVNAQIGPNAGLLSGNNVILQTREAMQSLMNYSGGSGSVQSLAALGIELDRSGKMSFNSSTFDALSDNQISDGISFLGSATTGLGSMASNFTQISDPNTGMIQNLLNTYDASDLRITDQISSMNDRINSMQAALQSKLQAADTLLASLASQQNILTSSIQSLNFASYGYQTQAPTSQSGG